MAYSLNEHEYQIYDESGAAWGPLRQDNMRLLSDGRHQIFNLTTAIAVNKLRVRVIAISPNPASDWLYNKVAFTSGGPVVGPAIGDIYNKSSFSDLSDFQTSGGYSAMGGRIVGGNAGTNALWLSHVSGLDEYYIRLKRVTYQSAASNNYGLGMFLKSANPNIIAGLSSYIYSYPNTPTPIGQLTIYDPYKNRNHPSSSVVTGYGVNSVVDMELIKNKSSFIFNVVSPDGTFSYTLPVSYSGTPDIDDPALTAFFPGISNASGQYSIEGFSFGSNALTGGRWVAGDSLTAGYNAGSAGQRYATQAGLSINAGAGDTTTGLIARLPEIINFCKPSKLFVTIGTNQANDAQYHADLDFIKSQVESAGISLVFCTPPANSNSDKSGHANYIKTTYPNQSIDLYTITKASSGTALNPSYDGGDGTHGNAAFHTAIASAIANSPLY